MGLNSVPRGECLRSTSRAKGKALADDKARSYRAMAVLSLTLLVLSVGLFAALMLLPLRGKELNVSRRV